MAIETAVRKRMQIAKTNKAMFLWITLASVVVGSSLVASSFLIRQLSYNERVLTAKQETVANLNHNLTAVESLKQEVLLLDANAALLAARANESDKAVQVILDALPSGANSLALGASLQDRLLSGIDGLTIESLQVDQVAGVEVINSGAAITGSADNEVTFTVTVVGPQAALQQVLRNLERSIRTIDITLLRVDGQIGEAQSMTLKGRAFYEPAKTLEFTEKVVK